MGKALSTGPNSVIATATTKTTYVALFARCYAKSFTHGSEMERNGVTHRILEVGPQVLHGIVKLSLLPQGSKDKALDVLRRSGQQGAGVRQREVGQRNEGQTRAGWPRL